MKNEKFRFFRIKWYVTCVHFHEQKLSQHSQTMMVLFKNPLQTTHQQHVTPTPHPGCMPTQCWPLWTDMTTSRYIFQGKMACHYIADITCGIFGLYRVKIGEVDISALQASCALRSHYTVSWKCSEIAWRSCTWIILNVLDSDSVCINPLETIYFSNHMHVYSTLNSLDWWKK